MFFATNTKTTSSRLEGDGFCLVSYANVPQRVNLELESAVALEVNNQGAKQHKEKPSRLLQYLYSWV